MLPRVQGTALRLGRLGGELPEGLCQLQRRDARRDRALHRHSARPPKLEYYKAEEINPYTRRSGYKIDVVNPDILVTYSDRSNPQLGGFARSFTVRAAAPAFRC
jgi:hypothetical protein